MPQLFCSSLDMVSQVSSVTKSSGPDFQGVFGHLQLLPLHQTECQPQGEKVARCHRHTTEYDMAVVGSSATGLPHTQ